MSVFWFVVQKSFFSSYWPAKKFPAFVGLQGAQLCSQNVAIGANADLFSADEVIPSSCCPSSVLYTFYSHTYFPRVCNIHFNTLRSSYITCRLCP